MDSDTPGLAPVPASGHDRGSESNQVLQVRMLIKPGHVERIRLFARPEQNPGDRIQCQVVGLERNFLRALEKSIKEGSVGESPLDGDLGRISSLGTEIDPVD